MINIKNKDNCCGCSACVEICPRNCISFYNDIEGFKYPKIDLKECIDCHLCEKVCPTLHSGNEKLPIINFAAINQNLEIRKKSSSGGIFYLLADKIINRGGVVWGARFNKDWEVVMDFTDRIDGLLPFMGSKYVQANPLKSYTNIKKILQNGKTVLFTGTPCQISGLRLFLQKDYNNLLLVDIICHGVPSPLFWQNYLKEIKSSSTDSKLSYVSFRNKVEGWKRFSIFFDFEGKSFHQPFTNNSYMKLFLGNYILRPSCYNCPVKKGKSGSDITIGDFWGIQNIFPSIDDDLGVSSVLINSEKGYDFIKDLDADFYECTYDDILKGNSALRESCKIPEKRDYIFRHSQKSFDYLTKYIENRTISNRIKRKILKYIRR